MGIPAANQDQEELIQPKHLPLMNAPLDAYLVKAPNVIPTSPYPKLGDSSTTPGRVTKLGPNAPVTAKYADAEALLKAVVQSRTTLETNLATVWRHRTDDDIFNAIRESSKDSGAADRLHIKKSVERKIEMMSSELEREIMDELLKIKEAANQTPFQIPEKDTKVRPGARSPVRGKGQQPKVTKVGVRPRINTGLRRAADEPPAAVTKAKTKESVAKKPVTTFKAKPAPKRKPPSFEKNEAYLSRVYGKAPYSNVRTTQKDPYLRFKSEPTSPKSARSRSPTGSPPNQANIKPQVPVAAGQHYYFNPQTGASHIVSGVPSAPVEGQLIPMAVPLRQPRQAESSIPPVPVHFSPAPSSVAARSSPGLSPRMQHPMTSTPMSVRIGVYDAEERCDERGTEPRGITMEPTKPKLAKEMLPPVDIDSEADSVVAAHSVSPKASSRISPRGSPRASTRSSPRASPSASPRGSPRASAKASARASPRPTSPVLGEMEAADLDRTLVEEDVEEVADDEEDALNFQNPIALPGYPIPELVEYHGPVFPPTVPAMDEDQQRSDVIASDIKRRDLLQTQAVEWVEQELMARMLSEIARQQASLPPAPVGAGPSTKDSPSGVTQTSKENAPDLFADTIGQEGLQLFVDAGVPVDDRLIATLVEEVINEKISSLIGQKGAESSASKKQQQQQPQQTVASRGSSSAAVPSPRPRPRSPSKPQVTPRPLSRQTMVTEDNDVPTPLPTPITSPRFSPPGSPPRVASTPYRGTPPQTPELTPSNSEISEISPPPKQSIRELHSIDDLARFNPYVVDMNAGLPAGSRSPPVVSRHDISTPSGTPPPSPSLPPSVEEAYTPDVSEVKEPTPPRRPVPVKEFTEVGTETDLYFPERIKTPPVPAEKTSPPKSPEPISPPSDETVNDDDDIDAQPASTAENIELLSPASPDKPPHQILVAPSLQERATSPASTISPETSISDTVNDCISEGQWLISVRSEGEVPKIPLEPVNGAYMVDPRFVTDPRYFTRGGRHGVDDTLHDTEDIESDKEDGLGLKSEGEVIMAPLKTAERDAMLQMLSHAHHRPDAYIQQRLQAANQMPSMPASGPEPRVVTVQPHTSTEQPVRGSLQEEMSAGEVLMKKPLDMPKNTPLRKADLRAKKMTGSPIMATDMQRGPQRRVPARRSQTSLSGKSEDFQDTQLSMRGTLSDIDSRAMTPDQMNINTLLESRQYLENTYSSTSQLDETGSRIGTHTQSVLQSRTYSTGFNQTAGAMQPGTATMGSADLNEARDSLDFSEALNHTEGSVNDMNQTGELTHSEGELAQYLDSLEVTQNLGASGRHHILESSQEMMNTITESTSNTHTDKKVITRSRPGALTVSVTIPSMDEDNSVSEESVENISEISMT